MLDCDVLRLSSLQASRSRVQFGRAPPDVHAVQISLQMQLLLADLNGDHVDLAQRWPTPTMHDILSTSIGHAWSRYTLVLSIISVPHHDSPESRCQISELLRSSYLRYLVGAPTSGLVEYQSFATRSSHGIPWYPLCTAWRWNQGMRATLNCPTPLS